MLHLERLVNLPVAVKTCLRKYACFQGRAPRSEFWWFYIFYLLACTVSILVVIWLAKSFSFGNAMLLLTNGTAFVLYLPSLAVEVCRLHDCGYSGNWLALYALLVYWGRFSAFAILIGFLLIPLPGDLGNLPLVICLLMCGCLVFHFRRSPYDVYLHSTTARRAGHVACLFQKGRGRSQPLRAGFAGGRAGTEGQGAGLPEIGP